MRTNTKPPLRISMAFHKPEGYEYVRTVMNAVKHIHLYALEIEADETTLRLLAGHKKELPLNAFQKILVVPWNTAADARELSQVFSDIVVHIPFDIDNDTLQKALQYITRNDPASLSVSFFLTAANIGAFSAILDLARANRIKKMILSNPDLIHHKDTVRKQYLRSDDLQALARLRSKTDCVPMQVHDYFLARFFGLKDADQFAGCQAGHLLCHIDGHTVYPCKSIPVPCGSLLSENFDTIWKKIPEVMNEYMKGSQCANCGRSSECKFGCPGTVYFINEGTKDPLCGER